MGLVIGILGIVFMASTQNQIGDMIGMIIVVLGAALIVKFKKKI